MNVFSKKFLSCIVLALSLGRSNVEAMDPVTIGGAVVSLACGAYGLYNASSDCCCKRRNCISIALEKEIGNVKSEVSDDRFGGNIGNRPEVLYICKYDLCDNDDCSALKNNSSYSGKSYDRGDINNYYKKLIRNLIKNNEELSNKSLSALNIKEISRITYVSKEGLWVFFGTCDKNFDLDREFFELFEHSLSNCKYDNFEAMIESWNEEMAKLFKSENKTFVPVELDNCDYKWEVSPEKRVVLERNGERLDTDERFRIVKLTINNKKSDNILTAQKAAMFFIVELNKN